MLKRGEIYYADLSPVVGSEQGGIRPVLVVQNWCLIIGLIIELNLFFISQLFAYRFTN